MSFYNWHPLANCYTIVSEQFEILNGGLEYGEATIFDP